MKLVEELQLCVQATRKPVNTFNLQVAKFIVRGILLSHANLGRVSFTFAITNNFKPFGHADFNLGTTNNSREDTHIANELASWLKQEGLGVNLHSDLDSESYAYYLSLYWPSEPQLKKEI